MRRPRHNMGRIEWIGAEALGVPGQRTFRLLVLTDDNSAQVWLEKEQLQAMAEAIARMLVEIDSDSELDLRSPGLAAITPKPPNFPLNPEVELFAGALTLRYDPQRSVIAVEAFERDLPDEQVPAFRCLATRQQMEALQSNIIEVISAGRPRCPLCGTPLPSLGVPHFCPPTNGHQKLQAEDD